MTDSDVKAPSGAATPTEAVACLREALDLIAGVGRVPGDGYTEARSAEDKPRGLYMARAALESLEAEVGRLTEALDYNTKALIEQSRKVRALESELAEKTARERSRPPGESDDLLDAIETVANMAEDIDFGTSDREALAAVSEAARSWAALQWWEPSTAPVNQGLLVRVRGCLAVGFYSGLSWLVRYLDPNSDNEGDWITSTVDSWLPLDALPALPSEPVKP